MTLVATDKQTFLHESFAHQGRGELHYFNGFNLSINIGFSVSVGIQPMRRETKSFICLSLRDGQTGFLRQLAASEPPALNVLPDIEVGGLLIHSDKPNKKRRVEFNGDAPICTSGAKAADFFL